MTLTQTIDDKLLLSFRGTEVPPSFLAGLREQPAAGVTLFRPLNIASAAQVRALTTVLQQTARAAGQPPLLIAADQEGGQLVAIGDGTAFPGNMALGATRSPELARQVGAALGHELAALGINVNFAPVCDVNTNPHNPVIGVRSFGDDPALVGQLTAAMIEGMQAAGLAATAKHFPGHGDTDSDSHLALPVLPHSLERLRTVEWPPFAAAVRAGVQLVMTAHVAVPALDGPRPATLSRPLLEGVLRGELGFKGVIVSDAMDMRGVTQWREEVDPAEVEPAAPSIAACNAGVDLLILTTHVDQAAIRKGLMRAAQQGTLDGAQLVQSAERVRALRRSLVGLAQPPLEVVGCAAHQALAQEVAARSITLVRDSAGWLPLRLDADERVGVIMPRPADLTAADTSSYLVPALADALRHYHPRVESWLCPLNPSEMEVAALLAQAGSCDRVIVGTINATDYPGQAALVQQLLATGIPTIAVALRLPYDLTAYPQASTYLCTYSIQPPSMRALAAVLCGEKAAQGVLPVRMAAVSS